MSNWKKKRSVMRRYNLTAEMYDDRYSEEQEAKYQIAFQDPNAKNQDLKILDVGCGSGLFFKHVNQKASTIIGIDFSKQLLKIAKIRNRQRKNIFIILADADHLPFKKNSFNFISAFTILQNIPNPLETLNQLKIVATQNAQFVITGLKATVSKEDFLKFLQNAGLSIESIKDDDKLRCWVALCIQLFHNPT